MAQPPSTSSAATVDINVRGTCCGLAVLCVAACLIAVMTVFAVDAARVVIGQGAYAAGTAAGWPAGPEEIEPGI
ncbi:MAG: hypothetical protein MUF81_20965 [Verrucomicrobia bacterium]|jgi:hypothetical protein|nr:hypothetical protein [Verrucomicrobiota bacterium]